MNRTVGELAARCDMEKMNFLAINLAVDIAEDRKDADEARARGKGVAKEAAEN